MFELTCHSLRIERKVWRPVLVKIIIIKLPQESVFSVTVLLFISLLCIFISGTNIFLSWLLIIFNNMNYFNYVCSIFL